MSDITSTGTSAIRDHIIPYIMGTSDLAAFTRWFDPFSSELANTDDIRASKLAAKIELALAEFSGGAITEKELKRELKRLAQGKTNL